MTDVLAEVDGDQRLRVLRNYFEAAAAIRAIPMDGERFGALLNPDKPTASGWRSFLLSSIERSAARYRAQIETDVGHVSALLCKTRDLFAAVPDAPEKVLAHGDFLPGNVLFADDLSVSAVVDFGAWTLVAEATYDVTGAAMFAEITSECTAGDVGYLRSLLLAGCDETAIDVMTCYRVYFAFTLFDPEDAGALYPRLYPWNVATLRQLADGSAGDWITTSA